MDVIGNNIANVNTVGFKASSVLFKDVLYQTTQSATGANAQTGTGGTNAKQIGLGTSLATISITQISGSAQATNNPYDLMLAGSSFFIVERGGVNYFTKVGAFKTDAAGNLVTGDGDLVMGWQIDPDNPNQIRRDTVSPLRPEAVENKIAAPEMTSKLYMSGNIDSTDPFLQTADGVIRTVTIIDTLGYTYTVKFRFVQDPTYANQYTLTVDSITDVDNVDILGTGGGYTATLGGNPIGTGVMVEFDADTGNFTGIDGNPVNSTMLVITPTPPNLDGLGDKFRFDGDGDGLYTTPDRDIPGIDVDVSSLRMYGDGGQCDFQVHRGGTDKLGEGRTVGTLEDVTIGLDGRIYGVYSNGVSKLLGQIAVANFVNPAGLEAIGGSLYKQTKNSGEFDGIGQEVTAGGGRMTQGVLEMSNVDLSQEFTEMIVTQRGFQANSRIITVSDTLIEELVNLKR